MRELSYLNQYFRKYPWHLGSGILFVLLSNWFRVLQPQEIRKAFDYVTAQAASPNPDPVLVGKTLLWFAGMVLFFALLMGLFMFFMRQTIIVMSRLIEFDLRNSVFAHYTKLNTAFYKRNNTGDMMARITEDVNKVRMYLGPAILYSVNLVGSFLLTLYAMLNVSPLLTLCSLAPLPFLSFSIYYTSRLINKRSEKVQRQLSRLNSIAQEVFSGIRVVKSYVREESMGDHFKNESEQYRKVSMRLAIADSLFFPVMLIFIGTSIILTVFVGGILISQGKATPGNIAEFIIYINLLTWPFTAIGWIASIVQSASASQKRINEFLKIEPEIFYDDKAPVIENVKGHIRFENMGFTYPDTGIRALEHISFEVKAGERVAIIGRTGSGKSTLAELMLRMYDTTDGRIAIDGVDIRNWNLRQLRQSIAYVPQDVFLFSDTVSRNIAFGNRGADQARIEDYARYASVYDDIKNLPKGFDTVIGERGVTLSGGQKQRISIARALIKDPDIILLDDCLSAVDARTEQEIVRFLDEVCANVTTLVITHRIHPAMKFDKVIAIEDGHCRVYETPEEILEISRSAGVM